MYQWLRRFHEDECGATIVEYSVLLTLIMLVSFQATRLCGQEVAAFYEYSSEQLGMFLGY